ncbi:MAG TPA: DUF6069 family protein [Micromonosporaceae bacterium]
MSTSTPEVPTSEPASVRPGQRIRYRLLAVAAAVVGSGVVWAIVTQVFGVDLATPAIQGAPSVPVRLLDVVFNSAVASIAGWVLLALLEKFTTRAATAWLVVALVVFVLSLSLPMLGTGATVGQRALLALFHVVVAAVLIPMLYRSSRQRFGAVAA